MTSTIVPVLKKLCNYDKINVIDVGVARGSFIHELGAVFPEKNIYSIGIDPHPMDNAEDRYTLFIKACVDNIVGISTGDMYIHMDTQANSLCINKNNAGTLEEGDVIGDTATVEILNLNTIIEESLSDKVIHFIKIDAEGKDLDIVESLSESTLKRVKYIALECKSGEPRFDGDRDKIECIRYMEAIGFDVDYEYETDNGSGISDVVFVNMEEL